ncbi:MAG: leucyl/phenylalanyl-tRNA--protein transferase [Acidimicrobiia bacterium]
MPVEPMPSRFDLPTPADDDGDVVAVGADLAPGTLLQAYRKGMFPMKLPDGHLGWWSPVERAILPLGGLRVSRSLKKSVRRFTVTVGEDFEAVVAGCADPEREGAWITPEFVEAYVELNRLGWAHSIEVWDADGDLAGGLYGVAIGGLFAGESMFHRVRDASKVALFHLVVIMSQGGGKMIDVQWLTPHLELMGAIEIGRRQYLAQLPAALALSGPFDDVGPGSPV